MSTKMATFSIQTKDEVAVLSCEPMRKYGVILQAFSTRLGGLSAPPYTSLNLGLGSGDDRIRVHKNRARFARAIGINPKDLVTLRQVHGNRLVVLTEATDPQLIRGAPGDGLLTNRPELPLGVITADCFPVILAAPHVPAVGIVHAGRQGIAVGVASTAIALMSQAFDVPPEAMFVAIGPGIGSCCYEVDEASAEPFEAQFTVNDAVYRPSRPGHLYLDLQKAIVQQFRLAGVPSTHIWGADLCTACHSHWFYSYRREGQRSGRMLNVVMIQPNAAFAFA
jgi:purine-nucleoside/S-methyl-5'-thioadenosine phosphorylase / adenosine deaminase